MRHLVVCIVALVACKNEPKEQQQQIQLQGRIDQQTAEGGVEKVGRHGVQHNDDR